MNQLQQTIVDKKEALASTVSGPLAALAQICADVWPYADQLDPVLQAAFSNVPNCQLLYAWDVEGIEISSMVQKNNIDPSWRGRDLSNRPYLKNNLPFKGVMLSSVYQSEFTHEQCITALQAVSRDDTLLGFIAADFALSDLLEDKRLVSSATHWQQFRGDPSIRGTLFMQERTQSLLDDNIDLVNDQIERLMTRHGVFHVKIHYSSGRVSLWLMDDPYSYRIHSASEIIDPDICLAYPIHAYPKMANVAPEKITRVLQEFKELRFADETIYLRSSSINIINSMLGLTFSCDGSHYMPVDEFLEKNLAFWLGSLNTDTGSAA
ncbi:MAG: PDC sensor domain-containing protein [Acidiferrobacterales bacterium]